MTDKELIQALRDEGITDIGDMMDCMEEAADRLEALLAENEHLREVTKMMPRWVSVRECLPEMMTVKFETRCGVHEYQKSRPVLGADEDGEIAIVCIICNKDNERWWEDADESGDTFDIAYWMPLPSTEGVE